MKVVTAKGIAKFRRAGILFTSEPTEVNVKKIGKKRADMIRNETMLQVLEDSNDPKGGNGNGEGDEGAGEE